MAGKSVHETPQLVARKNIKAEKSLIRIEAGLPDSLPWWLEQYFHFEVTTGESSRKVQRRDLQLFLNFMMEQEGSDERVRWSPRLSKSFQGYLRKTKVEGERRWNDRTINRIMAHLKTFAKWVHRLRPFPLGDPVAKIKLQPVGLGLEIERALTPAERRKMLDAADLLLETGGRSRDRNRYKKVERPRHAAYRPFRNRAIVYALIETGMRRAAACHLNLSDVDWKRRELSVTEKGSAAHTYSISREGLEAIRVYADDERARDAKHWKSPALFLSAYGNARAKERLSPRTVNVVWNEVCHTAGVESKTPHSARHAMGKHIIERTGNIAAVQRQLGHKNAVYSMQYARITGDELKSVIDDR